MSNQGPSREGPRAASLTGVAGAAGRVGEQ